MEILPNKFTPETISKSNLLFSIPLYQRLFEWDNKQIQQLLKDFYNSYKLDPNRNYYIGLLTVYVNPDKSFSLVDGQQRFTVLSLMALAFDNETWKDFLKINEKPRLTFTSRKSDSDYLLAQINKDTNFAHKNKKMSNAIEIIKKYVGELDESERNSFINYIFEKATFFISALPETYRSQDLNRYFESMNAAGKGLENHEILKVDLLKLLPDSEKDFCTRIWNSVSEMDKCLIRQKTWQKETVEDYRKRFYKALQSLDNKLELFNHCNDLEKGTNDKVHTSIRDIQEIDKAPGKQISTLSDRSILNFEEFLLQVLYIQFYDNPEVKGINFFDTHKLQQTFHKVITSENVLLFMDNLLKYRLLFDYYITRISYMDNGNISYSLNFYNSYKSEMISRLKQFQSMLYVSTSSHLWLTETLQYLMQNKDIEVDNFLVTLKNIDNKRNSNIGSLVYGSIERYWFWRLDYYLWENRSAFFTDTLKDIADKYVFKANRSIEHIAPQNPKRESNVKISEEDLHSFGNLAMISSGQNSALQNECFEVKRAYVESYINGSKGGSIESLKMLKIYELKDWNSELLGEHQKEMITLLEESFTINASFELEVSQN